MKEKEYFLINFTGYENYPIKYIRYLLKKHNVNDDDNFILAINEVVCNAARYNLKSIDECEIQIKFYFENNTINVLIIANTLITPAKQIKNNLLKIKNEKAWTKCLKGQVRGRGYWIILEESTTVIVEKNMQSVLLKKHINKKTSYDTLYELIKKFHIGNTKLI